MRLILIAWMALASLTSLVRAQDLSVATVTRPPFSMVIDGVDDGFSINLMQELARELGRGFKVVRVEKFGDMLDMVRRGEVDLAIANISITAEREKEMDFSQPIFESGLQILTLGGGKGAYSLLAAIFSRDLITAVAAALALLFMAGMLMWLLERRAQPFFDRPPGQALFPSFWWSLNLVVNGGFEERMPRTFLGRIFGVVLVISSLFIVSIFVAKITAVLTVDAIQNNVNSINDLYGKQVGTIEGSTAAAFLTKRDFRYSAYSGPEPMFAALEAQEIQAIVFDAPILAYYAAKSRGKAQLAGPVFLRENYGIALPSGSALAEPINRSLLRLRENGVYDRLMRKWFGSSGSGQ